MPSIERVLLDLHARLAGRFGDARDHLVEQSMYRTQVAALRCGVDGVAYGSLLFIIAAAGFFG